MTAGHDGEQSTPAPVRLTVLAGPVMDYAQATARQLADPMPYIEAVLVRQEGTK